MTSAPVSTSPERISQVVGTSAMIADQAELKMPIGYIVLTIKYPINPNATNNTTNKPILTILFLSAIAGLTAATGAVMTAG